MKTNSYCSECGCELEVKIREANRIKVHMYDSGGGSWDLLGSPFDPETGDRNTARVYTCPFYKRRWWGNNGHDTFTVYKGEIHWWTKNI